MSKIKESVNIPRYYYTYSHVGPASRGARIFLPGILNSKKSDRQRGVYEYDQHSQKCYLSCPLCGTILTENISREIISTKMPYTFPSCIVCDKCNEHWYVRLANTISETIENWKNPLSDILTIDVQEYECFSSFKKAMANKASARIYGDYGGDFYLACELEQMKCSEEQLIELATYVDSKSYNNPDGVQIYYELAKSSRYGYYKYQSYSCKTGINYYLVNEPIIINLAREYDIDIVSNVIKTGNTLCLQKT